ncbi:hypothetical protein ABIE16_000342 [Pseudomonas sp. 2725]|uniref:hypothetical protein n=1 Tax=Pseudomonas sp. 2725 TaxID=3156449 RepID=UPI003D195080
MNVSDAAYFRFSYPQAMRVNTENAPEKQVDGSVINEQRVWSTIEKLRSPSQRGITSENLDELEEFLSVTDPDKKLGELRHEIKGFRGVILWGNECRAGLMLREMEGIYSDFKKDLQSKWSGLANKPMGFTVTEDGQLKVTSPPNTLTARDEEILNALLNEAKGLQSLTLKHAKTVIELVKRDKPQFEGKVKLDLSNFHKMVDYGLLLNKGALDLRNSDSWLDQLHKKAEKDPIEKKTGLHIEA